MTQQIPVIFLTAKSEEVDEQAGFDLGAVDYITKPINPAIVRARVQAQLKLYKQQRYLEEQVALRTRELENNQLEIIHCLGRAAEYKDNETGLHVLRMSQYSRMLAEAYGANKSWAQLIENAAPMHDVGKIGIADRILLKPGKLDQDEWMEMKRHTDYGLLILGASESSLLNMAREIAISHHEKWDGSGYPKGLKGEAIPLSGRIVAIADVYDALTSIRPYKRAWTIEEAVSFIQDQTGVHFDPSLVPVFMHILPKIIEVQKAFADEE